MRAIRPFVTTLLFAAMVPAQAALVQYRSLALFNEAAGSPPVRIDFDTIASGTNLGARRWQEPR